MLVKLQAALLLHLWVGVATWYDPYAYSDPPCVYCKAGLPKQNWVAVNVRFYEEGTIRCGDEMLLMFPDGTSLKARALDAGPFDGYYAEDYGSSTPIVVDVPQYLWPNHPKLSSRVRMINTTKLYNLLEEFR